MLNHRLPARHQTQHSTCTLLAAALIPGEWLANLTLVAVVIIIDKSDILLLKNNSSELSFHDCNNMIMLQEK